MPGVREKIVHGLFIAEDESVPSRGNAWVLKSVPFERSGAIVAGRSR